MIIAYYNNNDTRYIYCIYITLIFHDPGNRYSKDIYIYILHLIFTI